MFHYHCLQVNCPSGWLTVCWALGPNCGSSVGRREQQERRTSGETPASPLEPENIVSRSTHFARYDEIKMYFCVWLNRSWIWMGLYWSKKKKKCRKTLFFRFKFWTITQTHWVFRCDSHKVTVESQNQEDYGSVDCNIYSVQLAFEARAVKLCACVKIKVQNVRFLGCHAEYLPSSPTGLSSELKAHYTVTFL